MTKQSTEHAWDEYLESAYKLGYTPHTIREYLLSQGYAPEVIDTALQEYDFRIRRTQRNALGASAFVMLLGAILILASIQPTLLGLATVETADAIINFAVVERSVPSGYYGAVTAGITGNQSRIDTTKDGVPDTASNYQLHRQKILEAGVNQIRMDMDLTNVYNRDGTFNKWNSCNTCNIDNHKSTVTWARQNNITVRLVAAYMPVWLANVTPACSANPTRCEPNNYTIWRQAVVRYIDEVGCDEPGTNCVIEAWNEPYLGIFLLPGGTCTERTQAYFRLYDNTRSAVKSRWPNMIVGGPVGFSGMPCARQLTESFFRNYSQAQVDEFILHQYSSSGNVDLAAKLRSDIAWVRAANHKQPLCFTEYNVNNPSISVNEPVKHHMMLTEAMMEGLRSDNVTCLVLFEWTVSTQNGPHIGYPYPANYIMFSEPLLDNQERASFTASRDFSKQHPSGMGVVSARTNAANLAVFATTGSNGKRITVANKAATARAVTLGFTDRSSGTLRNTLTGVATSVLNGVATLPSVGAFGVAYYEYTPSIAPPPPTAQPPTVTAVTIAAGASTILSGSSASCVVSGINTNSLNGTITLTWLVNGASSSVSWRGVSATSSSETFTAARAATVGERWKCNASITTAAGTVSRESSETLTTAIPDTTSPWVHGIAPAALSNTTNTSVRFTWETTDERTSQLSCAIMVNDALRTTVPTPNNTITSTLISLPIGSYEWYAICSDAAANNATSARRTFQVLAPPIILPIVIPVPNATNVTNPITNTTTNSSNSTNSTLPIVTPPKPPAPSVNLSVTGGTRNTDQITWSIQAASSADLLRLVLVQTSPVLNQEIYRTQYTAGVESASVNVESSITVGGGNSTCGIVSVVDTLNQTTNKTYCFTVANSPPRLSTPMLEGETGAFEPARELRCTVTAEDLDNTPLSLTIAMQINGTQWNSSNRTVYSGDVIQETVPGYAVFASDVWACIATIRDNAASAIESSVNATIVNPPVEIQATPSRRGGGGGGGAGIGRTISGSATAKPVETLPKDDTVTSRQTEQPEVRTGIDRTESPATLPRDTVQSEETAAVALEETESSEVSGGRQFAAVLGLFLLVAGGIGVAAALRHPLPKQPAQVKF